MRQNKNMLTRFPQQASQCFNIRIMPQIGGKFVCVVRSISAAKNCMNFKFSMGPQHTEMFKNLKCQRKMITITSAIVTKLKKLSLSRPPSTHSVVELTLAIVHFDRYNGVTIDESYWYSHRCCYANFLYFFQFCYDCGYYSNHFSF